MNDLDLVKIIEDLYAWNGEPGGNWLPGFPLIDDTICVAIRDVQDARVVCFRGSVTFADWFRDFLSEIDRRIKGFEAVGNVPFGFSLDMGRLFDRLSPFLDKKKTLYITGHSLGAARALIFAGQCVLREIPVEHVMTCGTPRPGEFSLKSILRDVSVTSYRNKVGDDVDAVTTVPTNPPYIHPVVQTDVSESPGPETLMDSLNPFWLHHISLYARGIEKLTLPLFP